VVLNEVQMLSDGMIVIRGECSTLQPILDFGDNLQRRTDLVTDVATGRMDTDPLPDPLNRFKSGSHHFELSMRHMRKHVPIKATPPPATPMR